MITANSIIEFEKAIVEGRLSDNSKEDNYAGKFMFMGYQKGKSLFKNIMTREYIK